MVVIFECSRGAVNVERSPGSTTWGVSQSGRCGPTSKAEARESLSQSLAAPSNPVGASRIRVHSLTSRGYVLVDTASGWLSAQRSSARRSARSYLPVPSGSPLYVRGVPPRRFCPATPSARPLSQRVHLRGHSEPVSLALGSKQSSPMLRRLSGRVYRIHEPQSPRWGLRWLRVALLVVGLFSSHVHSGIAHRVRPYRAVAGRGR